MNQKATLISIILGTLTALALSYLYFVSTESNNKVSSKIDLFTKENLGSGKTLEAKKAPAIGTIVEPLLVNTKGKYAIVIKNLKTQETYELNSDEQFVAASLYKLWVMATVFDQIQNGILIENQTISQKKSVMLENYNVDASYFDTYGDFVSMPLGDALKSMITQSDNDAAILLMDRAGVQNIEKFLKKHGLNNTDLGSLTELPATTANDVALFYEKLYKGELANPENTEKMIKLLKDQTLNHKIPRFIDQNVEIAHKTGELGEFSHDAGIVFLKNGDYIIVVLSKTTDPAIANQTIGKISQEVFNSFSLK